MARNGLIAPQSTITGAQLSGKDHYTLAIPRLIPTPRSPPSNYFLAAAFFGAAFAAFAEPAGFVALGFAVLVGLAVTATAAIFLAVAALRFARVLLLFATVLPVPLLPLRRFARLVVMFLRMGRKLCKVLQCGEQENQLRSCA